MNKLQKIILITGFAILAISLLPVSSVSAIAVTPPNLVVNFENEPLFTEANFLPGQAVTRYVDVTNNTSGTKAIGVKAKNPTSCSVDCLADQLKLVITDGSSTLYQASLTEFFGAGEKKLSDLAGAGATIRYYFTITFQTVAGNNYQNKQVGFDFDIGIFGQETIGGGGGGGGTIGGGGGGSSGGGGSFGGDTGLIIFDEASSPVVLNQTDITWKTNRAATSRVIYSSQYELPRTFDLNNPPNYGYAHSNVEDPSPVINHSMNISGLVPGVTYYYRVVSRGSFAISIEHSFTAPGIAAAETGPEQGNAGGNTGLVAVAGGGGEEITENTGTGGSVEETTGNTGGENIISTGEETQTGENPANPFLASLLDLFKGGINFCLILFLIVIIITILLFSYLFGKRSAEEDKVKRWVLSLGTIIVLIILYSFICPDYYRALLIIEAILFVIFLILYFYFRKDKITPKKEV